MASYCIGICDRRGYKTYRGGAMDYAKDAVCRVCEKRIPKKDLLRKGLRCPCCHNRVRLKPVGSSWKHWLMEVTVAK